MAPRRSGPPIELTSVGDIIRLIESDSWMVDVLDAVRDFGPPNAWVGAGFVRNKVWDALHGYLRPSLLNDVDVIYFDPETQAVSSERAFEDALVEVMPLVPWSVRNQARMHTSFGMPRALSTLDAMRYWPETVTAIAMRKDPGGRVRFVSCHGVDDLTGLAVRPAPGISLPVYRQRMSEKDWRQIWPTLRVYGLS